MGRFFAKCCVFLSTLILINIAFSCTDFKLKAQDGTILVTRSMEFALDLKSNVRSSNRGRQFQYPMQGQQAGFTWQGKYGYVFLDGFEQDFAVDGMNEKGLSFEALYLPGLAKYQTVPKGKESQAIPYYAIGDYILSNFENVNEVKAQISKIYVYEANLPGLGDKVFPLHFSVHDKNNQSIVIEYVNGQLHVYDNPVGVMTNSPIFPWHVTNLENYLYLSPTNPNAQMVDGITYEVLGLGFGMVGLPGNPSPPSRFVRMAIMSKVAVPVPGQKEVLNLGEHIINNVDIFFGLARENMNGQPTSESTEWVVFKDLTNLKFYYRTYENLTLRMVDFSKLDFSANAKRLRMPIASPAVIQDVTNDLLSSSTL